MPVATRQGINPKERADCERRAGRPLPTDEDVLQFLIEEREYVMKEEMFGGRRKRLDYRRSIEDRRSLALPRPKNEQ